MMKTNLVGSGLMVAVLLTCGATWTASGATIYQDNFDNVSVGSAPSPQVGTQTTGSALVGTGIAAAPSSPNYLDSFRELNEDFHGDLAGAALAPGTAVHAEMAVYAIDGFPVFGLNSTLDFLTPNVGDGIIMIAGSPGGATVYSTDSTGALQVTGLTHAMNTWQTWEIDYVVGASSYTLTIDGNSVNLGAGHMIDSAATQLEGVFSYTYSGTTHFLIDDVLVTAVPEPASLGLITLGLACALIRHRKS